MSTVTRAVHGLAPDRGYTTETPAFALTVEVMGHELKIVSTDGVRFKYELPTVPDIPEFSLADFVKYIAGMVPGFNFALPKFIADVKLLLMGLDIDYDAKRYAFRIGVEKEMDLGLLKAKRLEVGITVGG